MGALRPRIAGVVLEDVQIISPHLLRTVDPPVEAAVRAQVTSVQRLGKRIAVIFDNDVAFVLHLMIAGRLRFLSKPPARPARIMIAVFQFSNGTLIVTEAGSKKRTALHVVHGADALAACHPGGLEIDECGLDTFSAQLQSANHTLKRALTDQRLFAGIGNAYSDEILHAAGLSPVTLTQRLHPEQIERLYVACRQVLRRWTDELCTRFAERFPGPGEITAFRKQFAVHGRFGLPCPQCGTAIQRIRYADRETNYCPRCQTGGKLLADRSLSRLLKQDWPKNIDELEHTLQRG